MAIWTYPHEYNVTNFTRLFQYTNHVTGDAFATLICLGVWVVAFIALKNYKTAKALSASSFLATLVTMLFYVLEMVSYYLVVVFVTLTIIGSLYTLFKGGSSD